MYSTLYNCCIYLLSFTLKIPREESLLFQFNNNKKKVQNFEVT